MTTTDSPKSKPRRRFVLSLRFLIAFVLAAGAGLGWLARTVRIQREAIQAITQVGGRASYDYDGRFDGVHLYMGRGSIVPEVLRTRLGDDYFHSVTDVYLDSGDEDPLPGSLLAHLEKLPRLRTLIINGNASNETLRRVGSLTNLQMLFVGGGSLTNAGVGHLGALHKLGQLQISGGGLTPTALSHLTALPNLQSLSFECDSIEGDAASGLIALTKMKSLRELTITCSYMVSSGLDQIGRLVDLKTLRLYSGFAIVLEKERPKHQVLRWLTNLQKLRELHVSADWISVESEDLKSLENLAGLQNLHIYGERLTDAGLVHLEQLKKLEYLDLRGAGMKPDAPYPSAGLARLQKALPALRIYDGRVFFR